MRMSPSRELFHVGKGVERHRPDRSEDQHVYPTSRFG